MSKLFKSLFTAHDVEILSQQTGYQGYFRIEKYQVRHKLFNGGWSKPLSREVFKRGVAVGVLLFDPQLDKIILIEQFRIGAYGQNSNPWLLELVAGIINPDENLHEVAVRETMEETGLKVLDIIPICEYWASPGASSEKVALFCARVDASHAGGIHGLVSEGEDIRVWVFGVEEVYALLAAGKINNALSIIALQWFQLNEASVREQWPACRRP
jgi:ADP-ribose pyrophosphatase